MTPRRADAENFNRTNYLTKDVGAQRPISSLLSSYVAEKLRCTARNDRSRQRQRIKGALAQNQQEGGTRGGNAFSSDGKGGIPQRPQATIRRRNMRQGRKTAVLASHEIGGGVNRAQEGRGVKVSEKKDLPPRYRSRPDGAVA